MHTIRNTRKTSKMKRNTRKEEQQRESRWNFETSPGDACLSAHPWTNKVYVYLSSRRCGCCWLAYTWYFNTSRPLVLLFLNPRPSAWHGHRECRRTRSEYYVQIRWWVKWILNGLLLSLALACWACCLSNHIGLFVAIDLRSHQNPLSIWAGMLAQNRAGPGQHRARAYNNKICCHCSGHRAGQSDTFYSAQSMLRLLPPAPSALAPLSLCSQCSCAIHW